MSEMVGERYKKALDYATKMHNGQVRIGGDPYISHPVAVAGILRDWGYGEDYQICGLFHDLLEDTEADPNVILEIGGPEVLRAVRLLTKFPGYVMADYVRELKRDPMARAVKAADRLHNLRSAIVADAAFRIRYIRETLCYFTDLCPEITVALNKLIATLPEGSRNTLSIR